MIPFIERKRRQCAYIVDQPRLLVCGEPVANSTGSWCAEHKALCFTKGQQKNPLIDDEDSLHLWPQSKKNKSKSAILASDE
jgi:hypothetical protein